MPRLLHSAPALLLAALLVGPAQAADYAALYAAHDYFSLRTALLADKSTGSQQTAFYRAAVLSAFNQPAAANKLIEGLLAHNIDTALMPALLELRLENARRLSDYPSALDAERTLVDVYERGNDVTHLQDAQNTLKLLSALGDTPAQTVTRQADSHIQLADDPPFGSCIPVTVGKDDPCYILDSGANYSVLVRSEAERLGLKILPAGVMVDSSTRAKVPADVAVAPLLLLGNLEYHDVVFLVMPDAAFTFKDFKLLGILGYQVYSGMGAVTLGRTKTLDVPRLVPSKETDNIALDDGDILTQVQMAGHTLLCRVDTGANTTTIYKSYYDAYKAEVQKTGKPHKVHQGGAGGSSDYDTYELPATTLKVAGRSVTMKGLMVYTQDAAPKGSYLMCNLGLDVLDRFKSYTIDLASMALTLNPG